MIRAPIARRRGAAQRPAPAARPLLEPGRGAVLMSLLAVGALAGCGAPLTRNLPHTPSAVTVVTFGDSVPAGTSCDCTPFPDLYARRLGAGARSVNLAEPGLTAGDVADELDTGEGAEAVRGASVVLLMTGANDLADAFDEHSGDSGYAEAAAGVQRNVTTALTRVHELHGEGVRVLVLGYWNVVEDGDVAREDYGDGGVAESATATRYADDALRRAASAGGAEYLDTSTAFKGADGRADPTALLSADGDHPNADGQAAIAAAVYRALPEPPQ
ncbi:SGNH/GDSL hydrolase family protein [Krasilnikovia sp. MM14-A1259]|uniref:SGNH/GDSL hydrolase family protein n=1 Tax=Krasilnikovia sp. MM14-A1259 TaxID=3373539 RepID=UPI0037F699C6